MAHRFIQASSLNTLDLIVNGGVVGGRTLSSAEGRVLGLHGLTFIVNSVTITFSDVTGAGLKLVGAGSLKAIIEAAATGVRVAYDDGRLVLSHATGVTVDKDGTANAAFGFSRQADVTGVVYAGPGGTLPRINSVGAGVRMDSYFAHVEVV